MVTLILIGSIFLASPEAANVLVVVNDATVPETGTGTIGASQFVANRYLAARSIPAGNVVHINSKGCCGFADGTSPKLYNNFHVSMDQYVSDIMTPIRTYLEGHGIKHQIKYIAVTYGVPTHIAPDYSVDDFLSQMYSADVPLSGPTVPMTFNPVNNSAANSKPPRWTNVGRSAPVYLVTRFDGPSAVLAAGLIDKAINAEKGIARNSGTGYFDWQHSGSSFDGTMKNAYDLCVASNVFPCFVNDQSVTNHMIDSAPNALWAWGWYGGVNDVYGFVPGAVGAQLTSYTANDIRNTNNPAGLWVPWWITKGITATWGATGEPNSFYAMGDNLLNHMWNGYTFGESAYIANPNLGWKMIFVGDPLYTPLFQETTPPPPLTISPTSVSLSPGQSTQFTVSGAGADAVIWSTRPNPGSVSSSGSFTAPATLGETVTATSVADPTKSASAIVVYAPISAGGTFAPIRVNAGATTTYTDKLGQIWQPDTGFNTACNGLVNAYPNAQIGGSTTAPDVYKDYHYGDCTFTAAVLNGNYTVNLMFAEVALNGPGRTFNVNLNGQRVLSAFDIFVAAGGANLPIVKSFPVNVTGGQIAIQFSVENYGPIINGIEILKTP